MGLTIFFIIVYVVITGFLGYLGYRHTNNTKDYLLGGRDIHPAIMAVSYGATFVSTSAIIGFGGQAAQFGMGLMWLTFMNIFLGIFIAFVFFGKRTRKMGHNLDAHTFAEFIGRRYQSTFIQKFAGTIIFLIMPIYAAAVMIGATNFIQASLKVDYELALFLFAIVVSIYVFFGGMKAVMYSDAFQGALMFGGMLLLLILTYAGLGGVTEAHEKLTQLFNNPAAIEQVNGLVEAGKMSTGFQGWTKMPVAFSDTWWVVISSIVMGVGVGVLAQPQLVVRFMTVKSAREINRAVPVGGLFIFMMIGVAYAVGPLSNVYFFEKTGQIAVIAAGSADSVIPQYMHEFLPPWFSSVFFIVVLAAGMSTLSGQFHTIGTAVGRDLFCGKTREERQQMLLSRAGMLISIIFTIFLAFTLPKLEQWNGAIAISTGLFFGVCAASFLPMYVGAIFVRKLSKTAAISGMLSGFTTSMLWMMFIHKKESSVLKVCKLLFGKDTLAPAGSKLAVVDPIVVSLTVSILVTIIVGLIKKSKFDEKHIEKCFDGIK